MDDGKTKISRKEIYRRIFSTICYRIWLYRKRHYCITIIQVIMPSLILFMLTSLHSTLFIKNGVENEFHEYKRRSEKDLFESICKPNCDKNQTLISYVTSTEEYPTQFLEILENSSFLPYYTNKNFKFIKLKSEEEMLKLAVLHHIQNLNYIGGIVFMNKDFNNMTFVADQNTNNGTDNSTDDVVKKVVELKFKIRLVKFIPSELSSFGSFNLDDSNAKYYRPFMGLQLAVTRAFLNFSQNGTMNQSIFQLNAQSFPSPPHTSYEFVTVEKNTYQFVSISLVLGFTFVVYSLIRAPCSDQETKFKPYLHLMGFPRWSYWLCWILNDGIIQAVAVGLQIGLLFIKFDKHDPSTRLVKHGSPWIWSIFLLLYSMASVSFCTFLASFFKRGVLGTYIAATIWLLSYYFSDLFLPSYIIAISWYAKLAMCLVPNAALIWGITLMASSPGGIRFDTLSHRLDKDGSGISLTEIIIMLIVDLILYYTLTFMLDRVHPGLVTRKPWYSLFKPLRSLKHFIHCRCNCTCKKRTDQARGIELKIDLFSRSNETVESKNSTEFFSSPFAKQDTIILTSKLTKMYYNEAKAIDDVNLRVQVGQCTVIVGHHGSGKSTLINLLCGEISPTHGHINICGYDIKQNKTKIQALISVCTVDNVLCYDFTVFQHLLFIGKLKGMNHTEALTQAKTYLEKMELNKKAHKFPDDLLEIEKRKLCIIMAFMGNSKIVILDEPTKGIEEDMRKIIWDFILGFHGEKTILVTTYLMDEAYYLGNRVSILSNGKIVASGTSQHLERLFGTGYHLKLKLKTGTDQQKLRDLIQYHATTSTSLEPTSARMWRAMSMVDSYPSTRNFNFNSSNHEHTQNDDDGGDKISQDSSSIYEDAESVLTPEPNNDAEFKRVETIVEELKKVPRPIATISSLGSKPSTTFSRLTVTPSTIDDDGQEHEEIEVLLPISEVENFSNLFSLLENQNVLDLLGVIKWRVLLYEIDRAFKEANEYVELANNAEIQTLISSTEATVMNKLLEEQHPERLSYTWTGLQRFYALLIKRIMWLFEIKMNSLVQILTPIILLMLTIQGTNPLFHSKLERSEHEISLDNFPSQVLLIKNISDPFNFTQLYKLNLNVSKFRDVAPNEEFHQLIESEADSLGSLSGVFIAGLEVNGTDLTAMSSALAFHAGSISFELLLNTYLKFASLPEHELSISVSSHPIQNHTKEMLKFYIPYDALVDGDDEILSFAVILGFGFFVLCSGFTVQPVAERVWHIKHLQLNTSLSKFSYWLSFILCDWSLTILVAELLLIVMQTLPDHNAFYDNQFRTYFMGFYILAGYSSILLSYNASFLFRRANTCFYGMLSFNQVAGIFLFTLAITIQAGPTINTIFRLIIEVLVQPYCIPAGFYSLITLAIQNNKCELLSHIVKDAICNETFIRSYDELSSTFNTKNKNNTFDKSCCKCNSNVQNCTNTSATTIPHKIYFQFDSSKFSSESLWFIFALVVFHSIFFTIFLILMQIGIIENYIRRRKSKRLQSLSLGSSKLSKQTLQHNLYENESVKIERENVEKLLNEDLSTRKNHFIINLTSSTLGRSSRSILSNLALVCAPSSITTIYGPCGAGKSVLISILTKMRNCKSGTIHYNENELLFGDSVQVESLLSNIGYCPENIIKLYSKLTGLQLVRLFGRLRGISECQLELHVKKWLRLFSFTKRANEDFKFYSESMKRKLFIILSLIGDSQILIFDNPTKNLDPVSKYQFWTVLHHLVTIDSRTVILTTSRVEDLEPPKCTKLAILVNGKLQYVMSPQNLMNQLGKGYTIIISLKPKANDVGFQYYMNLKERLEKDLIGCILEEEQQESLRYNIPSRKIQKWSELFNILEVIKYDYQKMVHNYTIRETLLEDILHVIALKQSPSKMNTTALDEFCLKFC